MEPGPFESIGSDVVKYALMSKPLFAAASFALLGLAGLTASQAPKAGAEHTGLSVLEFHARNCQKCHGEEGELRSPGWADSKTPAQLSGILNQMVTEQAGHAPLNEDEMIALASYHRAMSRLDPWANLLAVSGRTLTFEATRDSRLSAKAAGKKVPTIPSPVQLPEMGTKLMRWTLVLPASASMEQLLMTIASGEGKGKKVVTWKPSESSFSDVLKDK